MRTYKFNLCGAYVLQLFSAVFILTSPTVCAAMASASESPESDTDSVRFDSDSMALDSNSIRTSDSDSACTSSPQEIMWYTFINDRQQGPFPQSRMEEMVDNGIITHYTHVNRAGTAQWVEAQTIFKFATPPRPTTVDAQKQASKGQSATERVQSSPTQQTNEEYLNQKARHVTAGNALAAIGMLGSAAGMVIQLNGVSDDDDEVFLAGTGVSIGFGVLRLTGVIASGVAARRYTRRLGKPLFSLGAFWGGFGVNIAGTILQYALGNQNVNAWIGIGVGTEILLDVFWMVHRFKAAKTTSDHRTMAAAQPPRVAVVPMANPRLSSYGLGLQMSY
ncbi:MAG: DUF4339 domain-containing protein [Deltaproteobacteria bacterium]|nr:DUF4339 domain-containing protein [Deltaproteobacteria bacterium]